MSWRACATSLAMNDSTSNSGPSVYRYPEDRRPNLASMASRLIHSGTAAATAAPRPATGTDLP